MLLKISLKRKEVLEKSSLKSMGKKEIDLENWMAEHLHSLLKNLEMWRIHQETTSKSEADIIALDKEGNTIIFELKRESADYKSIGQIFSYWVKIANMNYEELEKIAKNHYKDNSIELNIKHFQEFNLRNVISKEDFNEKSYLLVVAESASDNLWNIISFLRSRYGIPLGFIKFEVYDSDKDILIYFDTSDAEKMIGEDESDDYEDEVVDEEERYFWYNTDNQNEEIRHKHDMIFKIGVAATYGPISYGEKLKRAKIGDHIFAYANKEGIRAYGLVTGEWDGREVPNGEEKLVTNFPAYHLPVEWKIVLSKEEAIRPDEIIDLGYYGFRGTFRRIHDMEFIKKLMAKIETRNN